MIVMADVGTIPDAARDAAGRLGRRTAARWCASPARGSPPPATTTTCCRSACARRARAWRHAVLDRAAAGRPNFPPTGPFADLPPPTEVTVTRQVLAEPTPDIVERTWASLADGTPLVTGADARQGHDRAVPCHAGGDLVEPADLRQLRRDAAPRSCNCRATRAASPRNAEGRRASLAPYRMIAAERRAGAADARRAAAARRRRRAAGDDRKPARPLRHRGRRLRAQSARRRRRASRRSSRPTISAPVTEMRYALDESRDLKGPLVAAALALMVLDTLAVLLDGRRCSRAAGSARPPPARCRGRCSLALGLALSRTVPARSRTPSPATPRRSRPISTTRLAYVLTGDTGVDAISRAGLAGLTRFLIEKTALEPGEPAGVDIAKDELAFYPIIYWPIDPECADAVARRRSPASTPTCRQGGTVLFDTRDQLRPASTAGSASPATQRLRDILANLNVPPLEPVPDDHVLTKSFFILPEFPGPLSPAARSGSRHRSTRRTPTTARCAPATASSPIMITANDFAGAWAVDENGDADAADRAVRPDAARLCAALRRQHHDVHADRQLQIRPGARAGPARTAGAVDELVDRLRTAAVLAVAGRDAGADRAACALAGLLAAPARRGCCALAGARRAGRRRCSIRSCSTRSASR